MLYNYAYRYCIMGIPPIDQYSTHARLHVHVDMVITVNDDVIITSVLRNRHDVTTTTMLRNDTYLLAVDQYHFAVLCVCEL